MSRDSFAKRRRSAGNVLKNKTLLVLALTAVALTIIYFTYRGLLPHSKCDSIFEQTTDRLRANLDVVKTNGELILGAERVQELTEGSQKVAIHMKTCCIAAENRIINAEQFGDCVRGAKDYETKISQVATNVKEAQTAEEQQKPELAKEKAEQAKGAAIEATLLRQSLPPVPTPSPEWQVIIGDYADQKEALQNQQAAAKLGYSNSEIFGDPPHLAMRFRFPNRDAAKDAAKKLKDGKISRSPDVVPYRPKR